ncbi:MAG: hypothetical protein LQ349_005340 [Xanthoria aureola]|nr:MAG: hypothetical protein LQ349_005340 [Xanthoria aureola]
MVEQHIQGEASGTWEDNSAIEQHTQTDWCNDWDQHLSKQKAVVQNAQKAKSKVTILARLVNHTASLKGRLDGKAFSSRRQHLSGTTLVSLDHDEEYEDGEEYEDSDWAEVKPTVRFRVSKLTAKWRDAVKQKLDQVRGHKGEDEENEGFNDPWLSDDSEKQVGASNGPNEGSTLGIGEEPIFPKFTTPLPGALKTEDFLTRFLVERRQVNIYPERKHNLALSLFRICQEAAFDHVKLHAPRRLVLRGVDTADQLEFEDWIRLMDRLRDAKEIPHDGKDWYYSEIWFESYVQERDNILRLRQVAVHHWDYDSNMIGHVVEFLARLDDHPGRRMVENALAELHKYECVVAAKAEVLAISDACSWNQVGVPIGSTNSISYASSLTLVGKGSSQDARASNCDSRYLDCSAVDISNTDNEGDVTMTSTMAATDKKTAIKSSAGFNPMASIFVGDVFSPQLIDKSLLVTTHHQLLKSYQTILERSIYDAL